MSAATDERDWSEAASRIRAELAALRARFHAGWAVLWGPVPLKPRSPFACVLFEDRADDCTSALGLAVPLIANAWADTVFAQGGAVTLDATREPRLRVCARVLERNRITAVASGAFTRDGEVQCVVEIYGRAPFALDTDPVAALRAAAERIGTLLSSTRRAACAQAPAAPGASDPMTASALHDLKNALAAQSLLISGMERELRAVASGVPREPRELGALLESLAVLRDSVAHASELTRVMTLSAVTPGNRTAIDLPGLVRLALAAVPSDLRDRFEVEAEPELAGAGVVREAPALLRVMVTLAQNAALAIQRVPDARVTVRVRSEGKDEVLLEVDDEGPGVAPEVVGRLFEPGVTTRERPDGHGYALHAARAAVEALGGSLTLYSVPGRGARFIVRVPRAAAGLA